MVYSTNIFTEQKKEVLPLIGALELTFRRPHIQWSKRQYIYPTEPLSPGSILKGPPPEALNSSASPINQTFSRAHSSS